MQITEKKLRRLIQEQQEVLLEKRKFDKMLLEAEKSKEGGGKMLKMAFSALKNAGEKAGPMLVQWLKSNPELLEDVIGKLVKDEKIKASLIKAVKKLMTDEDSSGTKTPASSANGVEKPVDEGS